MGSEGLGPPYGPPANLRSIFSAWRERGLPPRIDRAWFEHVGLSGNLATRNLHALRYLRLTDDEGRPTELAEKLRLAPADRYAATLAGLIRTAYARIWAGCDPARATRAQIDDAFRYERPPAQRSRMVACFVSLCVEAAIREADPGAASVPRSRATRASGPPAHFGPRATVAGGPIDSISARQGVALLLAKFPDFDPAWSDSLKEKWFDAFARLRDDLLA